MKRRIFILLSFYLFIRPLSAKRTAPNVWHIIDYSLNHIFPKSPKFIGASQLNLLSFLKLVTKDKYFDKDDLKFLIRGAKRLYKLNKNYIQLSVTKKEKVLRDFEKTSFGQNWLAILMYYGFEAMLGDPIYGGNRNNQGWKNLAHNTGLPQPKTKYGKSNV